MPGARSPWTRGCWVFGPTVVRETHGRFDRPPTHGQRSGRNVGGRGTPADGRIRFGVRCSSTLGARQGFAVDRAVEVLRRLGMTSADGSMPVGI